MAERRDPLVGFHYAIEIQGVVSGYFTECIGIGSEHEVIEHKVVDEKGREHIQKLPGRLKWENVTLRRGITDDLPVIDESGCPLGMLDVQDLLRAGVL